MVSKVQDIFMLLGDSITQGGWENGGFGHRLSHVYARKLDLINRGLSGYNTEWAIPVFEQCFPTKAQQEHSPRVRLLTIWFGANDACIRPSPQHVPLPKFTENIRKLVHIVKSPESDYYSPDTRIILITPPPINTYQRKADLASRNPPLELDRKFEITQAYAKAVKDVGREEGVAVCDIWSIFWEAVGRDEQSLSRFFSDGLHPNEAGYTIVYESLMKTIQNEYPELHHLNLPYVFPPWAEINWDNPHSSLVLKQ
ncbi:hypothetical protein HGRIS_013219 [Hohenbuehelia grisea]|uniref:SGNH hydrolase-type esterase domain-containing protein n=1 Tax=Hohenbuehelia grisea TaxID=104357 RepID=A0ABR3IUW5_9AGAR